MLIFFWLQINTSNMQLGKQTMQFEQHAQDMAALQAKFNQVSSLSIDDAKLALYFCMVCKSFNVLWQMSDSWRSESQRAAQQTEKNRELERLLRDMYETVRGLQNQEREHARVMGEKDEVIARLQADKQRSVEEQARLHRQIEVGFLIRKIT